MTARRKTGEGDAAGRDKRGAPLEGLNILRWCGSGSCIWWRTNAGTREQGSSGWGACCVFYAFCSQASAPAATSTIGV